MSADDEDFDSMFAEAAQELQQKLHIETEEEKTPQTQVTEPAFQIPNLTEQTPKSDTKEASQPSPFADMGMNEADFQGALKGILGDESGDSKEAMDGIQQMMSFLGSQLKDLPPEFGGAGGLPQQPQPE